MGLRPAPLQGFCTSSWLSRLPQNQKNLLLWPGFLTEHAKNFELDAIYRTTIHQATLGTHLEQFGGLQARYFLYKLLGQWNASELVVIKTEGGYNHFFVAIQMIRS